VLWPTTGGIAKLVAAWAAHGGGESEAASVYLHFGEGHFAPTGTVEGGGAVDHVVAAHKWQGGDVADFAEEGRDLSFPRGQGGARRRDHSDKYTPVPSEAYSQPSLHPPSLFSVPHLDWKIVEKVKVQQPPQEGESASYYRVELMKLQIVVRDLSAKLNTQSSRCNLV